MFSEDKEKAITKGLVSIIMGVHNEPEEYIRTAVNSIINQTYDQIEFIIINDASNEKCKSLLLELSSTSSKIILVNNEDNLGLTKSLNKGLGIAKGEFIARMDADDISLPHRIEKQVDYLRKHPDIAIVGTGVISFGANVVFMSPCTGYDNSFAQCDLFFTSTLCHPSVMIRNSFLSENKLEYDANIKAGQDYDLWERSSICGKLAVMKDILLYYRTHKSQITSTNRSDQKRTAINIQKRRLGRIGINPSEKEYRCHQLLCGGKDIQISPYNVKSWVDKILQHNKTTNFVDNESLRKNLQTRYVLYKLRNRVFFSVFQFHDIIELKNIIKIRRKRKRILAEASNQMLEFIKQSGYEE